MSDVSLFWHRRDLRLEDNKGLEAARLSGHPVVGFFCFDQHILDRLSELDRRVGFIHHHLTSIQNKYRETGGGLIAAYGLYTHRRESSRSERADRMLTVRKCNLT